MLLKALEYFNAEEQELSDTDERDRILPSNKLNHPRFETTVYRKFEITELCELFVNKYFKYSYLVCLGGFCFLVSWSFSTVTGSTWAINFFPHLGSVQACRDDSFLHHLLPEGECLYAYYISLTIFAAIVVSLSLLDLKEQIFVQVTLGFLRFITIALIVLYCLVRLGMRGDVCKEDLLLRNLSGPINDVEIRSIVLKFDPKGWLVSIPVITYAFVFHVAVPSLTHPIKQRQYISWLITTVFASTALCYISLGMIVPLWFQASTQEICTLNWV